MSLLRLEVLHGHDQDLGEQPEQCDASRVSARALNGTRALATSFGRHLSMPKVHSGTVFCLRHFTIAAAGAAAAISLAGRALGARAVQARFASCLPVETSSNNMRTAPAPIGERGGALPDGSPRKRRIVNGSSVSLAVSPLRVSVARSSYRLWSSACPFLA
eukprot:CAMPEP_0119499422 /NCGR_PEP_ID=MMETSP1344-20130328/21881_1 /TAXON_ID=236787 /ORGANISM="Florenciella parvula, Strain CCMP2471" /LENGTH=160 /DNA_ID=CAMNT_0007535415 /DNA_START=1106 /DNA_END=1586 /DNA_ORIENTATION=-